MGEMVQIMLLQSLMGRRNVMCWKSCNVVLGSQGSYPSMYNSLAIKFAHCPGCFMTVLCVVHLFYMRTVL